MSSVYGQVDVSTLPVGVVGIDTVVGTCGIVTVVFGGVVVEGVVAATVTGFAVLVGTVFAVLVGTVFGVVFAVLVGTVFGVVFGVVDVGTNFVVTTDVPRIVVVTPLAVVFTVVALVVTVGFVVTL